MLKDSLRLELRDHAFGDREITWVRVDERGNWTHQLGDGYSGGGETTVGVHSTPIPYEPAEPSEYALEDDDPGYYLLDDDYDCHTDGSFSGSDARELLRCGSLSASRNDMTGPETYQEGNVMPGLTLEGVRKEICTPLSED